MNNNALFDSWQTIDNSLLLQVFSYLLKSIHQREMQSTNNSPMQIFMLTADCSMAAGAV